MKADESDDGGGREKLKVDPNQSKIQVMPRYLGLNYWQQVVSQRREFFSQSLLTVPHHLELTENYVHKNFNRDYSSWKCFLNQLCQEITDDCIAVSETSSLEEINILCSKVEDDRLEKFESETVSKQIGEGFFEVIPSSNPESLFSSDSDEVDLLRACDFTTDKRHEVFEEENLDNYQNEFGKDYLEDIFTSDNFSIIRDKIPQHDQLLERLHSRSLQDPLTDASGHIYTEHNIFGHTLRFLTESDNHSDVDVSTSHGFEVFEKHTENNTEQNELEEILTPFQHETTRNTELPKRLFINDTNQNYLESIPLTESSQETTDIIFSERKLQDIEYGSFSPTVVKTRTFVELNNEPKDNMDLSKAFIESPLPSPALSVQLKNTNEDLLQRLQTLQPLKPFSATDKVIFLRQFEMEAMTNKVWQHEKYFDEILALRLQEPDTGGDTVRLDTESFAIRNIKQQLLLSAQTGLGELELQLSWDPFLSAKDLMARAIKLEQLDYIVREKESKGFSFLSEEFHKFESDQFWDFTDSLMDTQTCSNTKSMDLTSMCLDKKAVDPQVHMLGLIQSNEADSKKKTMTEKPKELKNTAAILGVPSDQVSMDPLQNFLTMRKIAVVSQNKPAVETVCNRPSKSPRCIVKPITPMTCQPPTEEDKPQHRVMKIKLSESFEKVYSALSSCAEPYISVLKDRREMSREQDFNSLDPDSTKFLLKQREKSIQDSHHDNVTDDTYRNLLIVHALCGAGDLLVHCSLESAISYLGAMQEKHHTVLGGSLQQIRETLFLHQCSFHQKSILHPKITSVCKEVEVILNKESKLPENKVLIVLKRPLQTLMISLKNALSASTDISPLILDLADNFDTKITEEHNCLLASVTCLSKQDFLDLFTLVIEYEYQDGSSLKNSCITQNINFIGYQVHDAISKTFSDARISSKDMKTESLIQVTVVGSHLFTSEKVVLQILETRHNVVVFERDYTNLLPDKVHFADIVIDDKHGIALHMLQKLTEDWQVEQLTRRLVSLTLQLSFCWIILYSLQPEGYILSSGVISNVWKLQAALANVSSKLDQFQCTFKILLSTDHEDMACLIRACCTHCVDGSSVWRSESWSRTWMKEETSLEERFLLAFPCLNSFSAQLLLSRVSLGHILSTDSRTLSAIAPELPNKTITFFQKLINCDSGLRLYAGSPKRESYYFPEEYSRNELKYSTAEKMHKPEAKENINCAKTSSQHQSFPLDCFHIKQWSVENEDTGKTILPVKAIQSGYDSDLTQSGSYKLNTELNAAPECQLKFNDRQSDTVDSEDSMSLPCMRQSKNCSQEFTGDGQIMYDSQEYHKPNQYVLAEIEAKNLQMKTRPFHRVLVNDLDFESTIAVHSQPVHNDTRSGNLLENISYTNPLITSTEIEIESGSLAQNNNNSADKLFNNQMHFQSTENFVGLTQPMIQLSNSQTRALKEHEANLPEKRPFDFEIVSSRVLDKQVNSNSMQSIMSSASLPNYIRKAQNISKSFWSEEFLKSSQPSVTKFREDYMTSLPRRPVLNHHFANSRVRPPLQRISVGLAQPLRRTPTTHEGGESRRPADPHYSRADRRTTQTDSPPMDLEPQLQSPKLRSYTRKNNDKAYSLLPSQWPKCGAVKDKHSSQCERRDNIEDFTSSKKKKLTYKPLPGKQSGQTILTFR